jgi:hypothetical protein
MGMWIKKNPIQALQFDGTYESVHSIQMVLLESFTNVKVFYWMDRLTMDVLIDEDISLESIEAWEYLIVDGKMLYVLTAEELTSNYYHLS